jgi:hypothetical protein
MLRLCREAGQGENTHLSNRRYIANGGYGELQVETEGIIIDDNLSETCWH